MKYLIAALLAVSCCTDSMAMGSLKRILTNLPPVVVTNAPPVVTNAPPVVTNMPPPTGNQSWARWVVDEHKRWAAKWKIMGIHYVDRGILVSRYDRNGRQNSVIEEQDQWNKWNTLWEGTEETIGAEVEPEAATVYGDDLYFAAERGQTVLIYNRTTHKVRRGAKIPDGYKWNVFTATWKGVPVMGADGPDVKAAVFDMRDGKKLFTSPLDGLIAGMAEDDRGVLWLAVSDGQAGVCNSDGYSTREFKASAIEFVPGYGMVAGSQTDGKLRRRDGSAWPVVVDLDCSKVNRLIYSPRRQAMLVAAAKPDTFGLLDRGGKFWQIKRFNDEKKDSTGEQFDTDIKDNPVSDEIALARANGGGAYLYFAKTAHSNDVPPEVPDNPPAVTPSKFDPAKAKWIKGADPRGWPQVADLKVYWGNSGSQHGIYMEIGPGLKGKDCTAMVMIQRDQLYAGSWDDIGDSPGRKFKKATNLGYQNDKSGPYIAGTDSALRKKLMPQQGEEIAIMCACRDTKQTTRPTVLLWTPEK